MPQQLEFSPGVSRQGLYLQIAIHGAVALLILVLALPLLVKVLMVFLVGLLFIRYLISLRQFPSLCLIYQEDTANQPKWRLGENGGKPVQVDCQASYLSQWLMVLRLAGPSGVRYLSIFPDSLDAQALRRLRVLARTGML